MLFVSTIYNIAYTLPKGKLFIITTIFLVHFVFGGFQRFQYYSIPESNTTLLAILNPII